MSTKRKEIPDVIKSYICSLIGSLIFICVVIFIINTFHPFGYFINWKESFKKLVEQRTPLVLYENPKKRYYVSPKLGLHIASSYSYEYGLKDPIFPKDIPLIIKPPFYLRVGVANMGTKTLEDSQLHISLPDGVTVKDKDGWGEFIPNEKYFVNLQNINPKILMNIAPMTIKLERTNTPYEIKYTISGKDVANPTRGSFIIMRAE